MLFPSRDQFGHRLTQLIIRALLHPLDAPHRAFTEAVLVDHRAKQAAHNFLHALRRLSARSRSILVMGSSSASSFGGCGMTRRHRLVIESPSAWAQAWHWLKYIFADLPQPRLSDR